MAQTWDFASGAPTGVVTVDVPISRIMLHRDNMLLAAVLDDLSIGTPSDAISHP
jgi:hypothetical protein